MTERRSHKGPICPYCGHEHQADEAFFYDEDFCVFDCHSCDKSFPVTTHVQWTWTTRKVGEPA